MEIAELPPNDDMEQPPQEHAPPVPEPEPEPEPEETSPRPPPTPAPKRRGRPRKPDHELKRPRAKPRVAKPPAAPPPPPSSLESETEEAPPEPYTQKQLRDATQFFADHLAQLSGLSQDAKRVKWRQLFK